MKGYILNGTYDIHREISAKVIGVLKYNNNIRKELLERNIGFYNLLNTDDGIGYISNIYSNISSKPFSFDKNGLLGYTHYMNEQPITEYQKYIQKKYDFGDIKYYYNNGSSPDSNTLKWEGKYNDYRDYISEITDLSLTPLELLSEFFKDTKLTNPIRESALTIQSVLNDFIQYDNIKYAMEKNRIGTINPNPLMALLGVVTTNISNFSGKDTTLGLITNQLYANTLRGGAIFNSLRKTQYITPEVYDKLGNKLSTIATLGADFRIDDETGRLAYDLGSDFYGTYNLEDKSLTEWIDIVNSVDKTKDKFDNEHARLKNLSYNDIIYGYKNGYLPFENSSYAKFDLDTQKIIKPRLNKHITSNITWFEGVNEYHALDHETDDNNINSIIIDDNSLLKKTHNLFKRHDDKGIDTLIGRYYTTGGRDITHNETSLFQSAVDTTFGMSHGRNLLKKVDKHNDVDEKGYKNPYCRVWTNSNRYDEVKKLIRPFIDNNEILNVDEIQKPLKNHIRTQKGVESLNDKSVLNKNGFINITPYKISYGSSEITKCMFSIENLAWKDYGNENNLSEEQIGPNGGRIMWFPPYDLKFNENINVNWSSNDFIGRGEKIYSYTNTDRSGTLSFILLVDNPSILSEWKEYGEKEETPEEQEQQLLRFFAGCEPLNLKERGYNEEFEYNVEEKYVEKELVYIPYEPTIENTDEDIVFYIFFPNNYSGIDDDFDDALDYLINNYDHITYNQTIYPDLPWKYRVDKKYRNQKLKNNNNYEDKSQYNINTDLNFNFLSVEDRKYFEELYKDVTCSLKEIKNNFKNILYNKTIYKVILESSSTSVGSDGLNNELSRNRMIFGKRFIRKILSLQHVDIITDDNNIKINHLDNINSSNVSTLKSKLSRYVKITLKSKEKTSKNMTGIFNNILVKNFPDVKENIENQIQDVFSQNKIYDILNEQEETINKNNEMWKDVKYYVNTEMRDVEKTKTITITEKVYVKEEVHRSDEEYKYFQMLESNDNFSYSKLVDKIKYFSPAFHSITPEGFNSRLSFLHQCTRQGPTLSVSDKNNEFKSAGNLAFGRPPICVLRIGDFYHTRIVIESVSIDFNDSGWDMNPEGIGVQPMFAKISLNFKFLGGSDLYAPISRLQNALSFNYYANQGVYDNRSDKGIYKKQKNVIDGTPWTPQ